MTEPLLYPGTNIRDSSGNIVSTFTGGGGAATIADGGDVAEGSTTDAANTTATTGTVSGKLRGVLQLLIDLIAKTPALGTAGTASSDVITVQGIASGTVVPVSLSSDIEIGGVEIKNGTDDTRATVTAGNALKVDASAAPQPVTDNSGSLTVDAPVGTPVFTRLSDGAAAMVGQKTSALSLPVVTASDDAILGTVTETAPATDTASSGHNGRLQRIAQRLSSIIALLPTALGTGGGLKVDGSGTALPISQATASSLNAQVVGVAADGAAVAGNPVLIGGQDGTNAQSILTDTTGRLAANVTGMAGNSVSVNTGTVGSGTQRVILATDQARLTNFMPVDGAAASGATVAGNPILGGGRGSTTNPTAVTDGQAVAILLDKLGKTITIGSIRTLRGSQRTVITSSTAETTIITATASVFHDIYGLLLTNISSTGTEVDIRDDTGGTIIATVFVPGNDTRGFTFPSGDGWPQTTVNKNWTATCITSVASLHVSALFTTVT